LRAAAIVNDHARYSGPVRRDIARALDAEPSALAAAVKAAEAGGDLSSDATEAEHERRRVARALSHILTNEPDSTAARAICDHANALGEATSSGAHDFRPEYMLAGLFEDFAACNFKLDGNDRDKARGAYDALKLLAGPGRAVSAAVTKGKGAGLAGLAHAINAARQRCQSLRGGELAVDLADRIAERLKEAARLLKGVAPPAPKPSRPTRRRQLWRRDPRCFWCGRETRFDAPEGADDLATLEHVYARTHPKRQSPRRHLPAAVLACYRCNH
jgi:hypothetical protein